MKIRNYNCVSNDKYEQKIASALKEVDGQLKEKSLEEHIVDLGNCIGKEILLFPFNHMTEISAYGGNVVWDGEFLGKNGDTIYNDLEELLKNLKFNWEDDTLLSTINSARLLQRNGIKVLYSVSGPMTILNGIIDITRVFKGFRRDRKKVFEIFKIIMTDLEQYISLLNENWIRWISFSDSIFSVDILGPKVFSQIMTEIIHPFLRKITRKFTNIQIVLCPKISLGLMDCGLASLEEVFVESGLNYLQVCESLRDKANILGKVCPKDETFCTDNCKVLHNIILVEEK
ncbi:hypothetical protein [Lagierella sp.]|uniref:hypothetical protein n=1 Tax=Lagierella sp. TaxID=2849657 RepID=UPI0026343A45|nr:hypothetical protein [Lagierella sp.]